MLITSRKRTPRGVRGQGLVEYALIVVLVAIVAIPILYLGGLAVQRIFGLVNGGLGETVAASGSGGGTINITESFCTALEATEDAGGNPAPPVVGLSIYGVSNRPPSQLTASTENSYNVWSAIDTDNPALVGDVIEILPTTYNGNNFVVNAIFYIGTDWQTAHGRCPKVIVVEDRKGAIAAAPITRRVCSGPGLLSCP